MGLTVIFIAHDLSVVRHMCDRVAVMYLGKIVELASNEHCTGSRAIRTPAPCSQQFRCPTRRGGVANAQLLSGDVPSPANLPSACRFHTRCPKAQALCSQEEPPLEDKGGGTVAACHFPLTEAEVTLRLPAALTAPGSEREAAQGEPV